MRRVLSDGEGGVYADTGRIEMESMTGMIYLGDPRVERYYLILSDNEMHSLSSPALGSNKLLPHFDR